MLFADEVKIQTTTANIMNTLLQEPRAWVEVKGIIRGTNMWQIITGDSTKKQNDFGGRRETNRNR